MSATGKNFGPVIIPTVHIVALLYTLELFYILEENLIDYDDDFNLMAVDPSPGVKVTVIEFLTCDLCKVCEWCDLSWMKLHASRTKTMVLSIGYAQCIISNYAEGVLRP